MNINIDVNLDEYKEMCRKLEEYQGKYDEVFNKRKSLSSQMDRFYEDLEKLEEDNYFLNCKRDKMISKRMITANKIFIFGMLFPIAGVIVGGLYSADVIDGFCYYGSMPIILGSCISTPLIAKKINVNRKNKIINSEEYKELNDKTLNNDREIEKIEKELDVIEEEFEKLYDDVVYWEKLAREMKDKFAEYERRLLDDIESLIYVDDNELMEEKDICKKRTLVNVSQFKK